VLKISFQNYCKINIALPMSYFASNIRAFFMQNEDVIAGLASDTGLSIAQLLNVNNKTLFTTSQLAILANALGCSIDLLINNKLIFNNEHQGKSKIKMLVCDVDGVLTDGGMYYTSNGEEMKRFNTKDGMALMGLMKRGIKVGFLSSGFDDRIIKNRASILGVEYVYVGREPKIEILQNWIDDLKLDWSEIAYIGDDINDLECMKKCGLTACPADAVIEIKKCVNYVLKANGGAACVRELIDSYIVTGLV
jgi:YrbI family 3-deoxy-D-manno-octulosonate 8-phosphate phosphatase